MQKIEVKKLRILISFISRMKQFVILDVRVIKVESIVFIINAS